MFALGLGLFLMMALFLSGAPMFVAIICGSLPIYLWYAGLPVQALAQISFNSIDSFVLVAVPFYILLGHLMTWGGAADALFRFARAFFGHIRAGLGVAAIVACAFFGTMCGSTVATALAIGSIVAPQMKRSGWNPGLIATICAHGGGLGILIPPSIAMILLAEVTMESPGALFIAGIIPGIICTIAYAITIYLQCRGMPEIKIEERSSWRERGRSIIYVLPAMLMPVAILGSIYGGIATPTESAAVACAVALALGFLAYRQLTVKGIAVALRDTLRSTVTVHCIVFSAVMFGKVLGYMGIPAAIGNFVLDLGLSQTAFLLAFLVLFVLFGCIFDALALYFVCLPPFLPAIHSYGFDMIAFDTLFVLVVMVGQITPPVGITLWASAAGTEADAGETLRKSTWLLTSLGLCMLLIAFVPELSTWLPSIMIK